MLIFNEYEDYDKNISIIEKNFNKSYDNFSHHFFGLIYLYTFYFDQYMKLPADKINFSLFYKNMLNVQEPVTPLKIVTSEGKILNNNLPQRLYSNSVFFLVDMICIKGMLNTNKKSQSIHHNENIDNRDPNWINNIYSEYEIEIVDKICDPNTTYRQLIRSIGPKEITIMCNLLRSYLIDISRCFVSKTKMTLYRVSFFLDYKEKYHIHNILNRFLSTATKLSDTLVTFGLNKYLYAEEDYGSDLVRSSGLVIEKININEGINLIPTSLCTLQEESELVLIPGTKLEFVNQKLASNNDILEFKNFFHSQPDNRSYNIAINEWKRTLDTFKQISIVEYNAK